MNKFRLERFYTPISTPGRLFDSNNLLFCQTVERPHQTFGGNHPAIPEGVYKALRYASPVHGNVWMLQDVPGRSEIEIHVANWPSELLGCIALGQDFSCHMTDTQWGVGHSQVAFDRFMMATAGENELEIAVMHAELT